jgi:exopolysaccharide biosynthesis polyprenyl glycosylphosphotransferase
MIRRHATLLRVAFALLDAVGALGALVLAGSIRFTDGTAFDAFRQAVPDWELATAAFVMLWPAALWSQGLYRIRARLTVYREVTDIARSTVVFALIVLSLLFVLKLPDVSRGVLVLVFPGVGLFALASRYVLREALAMLRRRGRNTRYVLVLGTTDQAQRFADLIESQAELGLQVIGHLKTDGDRSAVSRKVLGDLDDLADILHEAVVDEVAICLPVMQWELIDSLSRMCEEEGKIVRIPMYVLEHTLSAGRVEEVDGLPIYSLVTGPERELAFVFKRLVDVVGSVVLLVLVAPVVALISLAIRLDSSGPIYFHQERVGIHGRRFRVLKFRTMVADAEARLESLQHRNEIAGPAFKVTDDPRITRAGRFLRATSLDELPQLWNVLRGEMSLVGPRPPLPSEVAAYDIWHRRRLSMKPGITGLWQVAHRRARDFDRWVEADLEYIDGWSLWLDFSILARTIPAVLRGEGR